MTFTVYRELLETKLTDLERQLIEKTAVGRTVGFALRSPLTRGRFAAWG
jgi:hypothetical protein